jgi:formate dehydrogenase subunit beta
MAKTAKIEVNGQNVLTPLRGFLKALLTEGGLDALLVARQLPMKPMVMPALVANPEMLDSADPLAPAFPMNAARMASRLTRKPLDNPVGIVLRPCEIRAFIELVKLKQGRIEDVVIIGTDCLGAYGNTEYAAFAAEAGPDSTNKFCRSVLAGEGGAMNGVDISPACKACEYPIPDNADILVGLLGVDTNSHLLLKANTSKGEEVLRKMKMPDAEEPEGRSKAIADLIAGRIAYRDAMFEETSEATSDLVKLMGKLSGCINCYNCRVACPVCYCKECVFVTDVFEHEPSQYLRWAKRKGAIKMPTDTVFYHLTRMVHMSTACIGCGQCSNACPNNIPVMEIFRTIAHATQSAFGYQAGRSIEEPPPLSIFREKEFSELTGGRD